MNRQYLINCINEWEFTYNAVYKEWDSVRHMIYYLEKKKHRNKTETIRLYRLYTREKSLKDNLDTLKNNTTFYKKALRIIIANDDDSLINYLFI